MELGGHQALGGRILSIGLCKPAESKGGIGGSDRGRDQAAVWRTDVRPRVEVGKPVKLLQ